MRRSDKFLPLPEPGQCVEHGARHLRKRRFPRPQVRKPLRSQRPDFETQISGCTGEKQAEPPVPYPFLAGPEPERGCPARRGYFPAHRQNTISEGELDASKRPPPAKLPFQDRGMNRLQPGKPRPVIAAAREGDKRGEDTQPRFRWRRRERVPPHLRKAQRRDGRMFRQQSLRFGFQCFARARHLRGRSGKARGIKPERSEQRQRLAGLHAIETLILVAGIEDRRKTRLRDGGRKPAPGKVEKRPQQTYLRGICGKEARCRHCSKAIDPAPPRKPQKKSLRLILKVMRRP